MRRGGWLFGLLLAGVAPAAWAADDIEGTYFERGPCIEPRMDRGDDDASKPCRRWLTNRMSIRRIGRGEYALHMEVEQFASKYSGCGAEGVFERQGNRLALQRWTGVSKELIEELQLPPKACPFVIEISKTALTVVEAPDHACGLCGQNGDLADEAFRRSRRRRQ